MQHCGPAGVLVCAHLAQMLLIRSVVLVVSLWARKQMRKKDTSDKSIARYGGTNDEKTDIRQSVSSIFLHC